MTSLNSDSSSLSLKNILPSYLINELVNIKNENESQQSKLNEDYKNLNSPLQIQETVPKIEKSPKSFNSFEYFNDSPETDNSSILKNNQNIFEENNKSSQIGDKSEFKNIGVNNNNNLCNNNNENILINNNNIPLLNMKYRNINVSKYVNTNENITYLNNDIYNSNYFKNNYVNSQLRNCTNNGTYINNINSNNFPYYSNPFLQSNQYKINPFVNNYINNETFQQKSNMENVFNRHNEKKNGNYYYENNNFIMNNINKMIYPEINNINNYFNNINNINIIQNNFIGNTNYINNNILNSLNSFKEEEKFQNQNNIYDQIIHNKNLDDFLQYINSLPMSLDNFLCTPKGILEIQKKLDKSSNEHRILLVNILRKQGLSKIMKNTYGNYFFQQLIKKNEQSFISLVISYIEEDLIDISKDFQGTFCLQALLDEINSIEEEQKILNRIKNYEMEMAFNKNATHVLQKIVSVFPDIHRLYLNEIILNNFISLCLDSNGICLIKIFIKTNTLINNKKRIIEKFINNFVILAESPFGNYGVQYLMEIWDENDLKEVKDKILENIHELSLQQFSSNVIEKAIEIFNGENREKMLKKLCFEDNFIINLLNNKFGKFVLNKAIKFMQTDMINEFEFNLNNDINNNIYKNKDKNKIKKLLMKIKNSKTKSSFSII